MNEQRNDKILYLTQRINSLQTDWYNLLARLQSLEKQSMALFRNDMVTLILNQENVLKKNSPNKKIYRSISNFADKIELELNNIGRER